MLTSYPHRVLNSNSIARTVISLDKFMQIGTNQMNANEYKHTVTHYSSTNELQGEVAVRDEYYKRPRLGLSIIKTHIIPSNPWTTY